MERAELSSSSPSPRRTATSSRSIKSLIGLGKDLNTVILMAAAVIMLLLIDGSSKAWVQNNMELGATLSIWPGFFQFAYYVNRGAVTGFGQHSPLTAPLLAVVGAAFIPMILFVYRKYTRMQGESLWIRVFLVTALAAMISTVLDRARFGYVVDFIAFSGLPIFNFADLLPPLGALALVVEVVTNQSLREILPWRRERRDA